LSPKTNHGPLLFVCYIIEYKCAPFFINLYATERISLTEENWSD
jgi:hypothetical protein